MASIYSVADYLTTITYDGLTVINVFTKIKFPDELYNINYYNEYIVKDGDRWDILSSRFYGTPNLWWLLATYNKILDPFTSLNSGDTIKIVKSELISNILLNLKGYIK